MRTSMSWLLLVLAFGAGTGACVMTNEDDESTWNGASNRLPLGVRLVLKDPPRTCADAVSVNQSFNCLSQAWINLGTVEAMRTAADNCGCIAEIVTTNVVPAACNVRRVAAFCPGTPPFNAVSPIPPGDYPCTDLDSDGDGQNDVVHVDYNNEPPFVGIHADPENSGRLCDTSLTANGAVDRPTVENCAGCHTDNEANWSPTTVVAP